MSERSISAYDLPGRVASYDADMDLMHPNRATMVRVALEVLPFERSARVRALDLGVGTGYFTDRFLEVFPGGTVLAIDGAAATIELAKARLGARAHRVEFEVGDCRDVNALASRGAPFDVVLTSFALHHLNREDKSRVIRQSVAMLRPGGWFVNADIIVAESPELERRAQELRVAGIVGRAAGKDGRFPDAAATRRFLDEMETNERDQPQTLADDLAILRASGLDGVGAFWLEYRELVSGGVR